MSDINDTPKTIEGVDIVFGSKIYLSLTRKVEEVTIDNVNAWTFKDSMSGVWHVATRTSIPTPVSMFSSNQRSAALMTYQRILSEIEGLNAELADFRREYGLN